MLWKENDFGRTMPIDEEGTLESPAQWTAVSDHDRRMLVSDVGIVAQDVALSGASDDDGAVADRHTFSLIGTGEADEERVESRHALEIHTDSRSEDKGAQPAGKIHEAAQNLQTPSDVVRFRIGEVDTGIGRPLIPWAAWGYSDRDDQWAGVGGLCQPAARVRTVNELNSGSL